MRYKLYKEQNKLRLNKNQGKEKLIMKAVLTMFSAVLLAAAAMAAEQGVSVKAIEVSELQKRLVAKGAYLGAVR